jgi:hypothetical protein
VTIAIACAIPGGKMWGEIWREIKIMTDCHTSLRRKDKQ